MINFYIAVILTLIAVLLIFENFLTIKNSKGNLKNNKIQLNYQQLMDDLMKIIQYKCMIAYRRILKPLVDKSLKGKPLLNDKIVNAVSIQVTKEIMDELSDDYFNKLYSVYKKEKIEDIILELVYNTVTEMALTINKGSIKQMNLSKTFSSFTKNDFDD